MLHSFQSGYILGPLSALQWFLSNVSLWGVCDWIDYNGVLPMLWPFASLPIALKVAQSPSFTRCSCAQILGNVIGGQAGDLLAAKYSYMGRIWLAQISTSSSVVCALIVLLAVPPDPSYGWCFALIFAIFGFFGQGYSAGANNPMLAAVAPPELRSTVMAWAYGLEIAGAAVLGPPIVGLIAQEGFGYVPSHELDIASVPVEQRWKNAQALRSALVIMSVVPFSIATGLYFLIRYTYPKDRDAQLGVSTSVS